MLHRVVVECLSFSYITYNSIVCLVGQSVQKCLQFSKGVSMKVFQKLTVLTLLATAQFAVAASDAEHVMEKVTDSAYFNVTEVSHQLISDVEMSEEEVREFLFVSDHQLSFLPELDEANIILDKIINIGQKIWTLVEKGRPVVNVNLNAAATAMPQGITSWQSMEGWQAPRAASYRVALKNLYNWTVVDFTYRVLYIPGGSVNGKGKYLARIAVQPRDLYVAWGYSFSANAEVPTVMNVGTAENPVGGAEVYVNWTVSTVMNESRGSGSYFVAGDGRFANSDRR